MKEKNRHLKTDWKRVDAMTDADIDYSDIPELDEKFWKKAKVVVPVKRRIKTFPK